jgi:lipopolysaccharide/colanic/teichoic acid biosynthesis glycosyltransferase
MRGRVIQQKPVLGTTEELQDILQSLEVHGVTVDKIIVATAADRLRPQSLEALLEIEKSSDIVVQFLSERLGLDNSNQRPSVVSREENSDVPRQKAVARVYDTAAVNWGTLRRTKRIVDIFAAVLLVGVLSPVLLLVSLIVALDVGFPLIFWQQRPGLCGRPFKLYKFRTMGAPHDKHKNRISDDVRLSAIGKFIRRTRLDELAQLYNVLLGDMSLIGPRPLLPCDQSPDYADRLSVRPGLTGWAQVNGGRIISTSDKLMLDIWYVQNASLMLDLAIVLRTMKMILFGDRINTDAVIQARSSLGPEPLRATLVPAE